MAMRRSRKAACFCRARLAVGPRGILTAGGAAAASRGSAVFAAGTAEVSGAGVDDDGWMPSSAVWRDVICAGRPMSLMLEVARTETFGFSRRTEWGKSGVGEVSRISVPRVDVHSQE